MILNTVCNSCLSSFQLLVEASDIELIKEISDEKGESCPCPRLCGGRIFLLKDPTVDLMSKDKRLKDPLHISGKELYKAVHGLGLPDEIPTESVVVESMLKSAAVTAVSVQEIHGKVYLHEIRLANGVTLHLGSGQYGAHVLKMTKER